MGIENYLQGENYMVTSLTKLVNWSRSNSVWPCTFGLACCALEMIASTLADFDISRFGSEVFRPSPRQADLLIVAGTLSKKMSVMVKRIYDQMADPKWVIAMGACGISGGIFRSSYNVVPGYNRIIPVDVYIPGCPPRPEALLEGWMRLQEKVRDFTLSKKKRLARQEAHSTVV